MTAKRRFAFLDTWLLSRLTDTQFSTALSQFLKRRRLVPACTTLSFVEIYNPGWDKSPGRERGELVAEFIAEHDAVLVEPTDIFQEEYERFPARLREMPIRLDLSTIDSSVRTATLLRFLRRHPTFVDMDKDISSWAARYTLTKSTWVADALAVVNGVIREYGISRRSDGSIKTSRSDLEVALLSLDLRLIDGATPEQYIEKRASLKATGPRFMRGARATSLAMWHLYAVPDSSDKLGQRGSDIGDIMYLALAPYCDLFTTDATMHRLLKRIAPELGLDSGVLADPAALEDLIRRTAS